MMQLLKPGLPANLTDTLTASQNQIHHILLRARLPAAHGSPLPATPYIERIDAPTDCIARNSASNAFA